MKAGSVTAKGRALLWSQQFLFYIFLWQKMSRVTQNIWRVILQLVRRYLIVARCERIDENSVWSTNKRSQTFRSPHIFARKTLKLHRNGAYIFRVFLFSRIISAHNLGLQCPHIFWKFARVKPTCLVCHFAVIDKICRRSLKNLWHCASKSSFSGNFIIFVQVAR